MKCDILTKSLPEAVKIQGISYPINWDFRVGIQLDALLRSKIAEEEKCLKMLQIYYPSIPPDIALAIEAILWFYRCGEEPDKEEEEKQRYKRRRANGPVWAFSQDAAYIYSAFREQYGIDLTQPDKLHWWKFMALFESLGEDTKMSRIIYYRQASTAGMSKLQRAYINEMKKLYRIEGDAVKRSLAQRDQGWKDYVKKRHMQGA